MSKEAVQKGRAGRHVLTALVVKFVLTFVLAWIAFGLVNSVGWRSIFLVAIVATVVNYIIADLLVLRASSNIAAAIVDGIIAAAVAWLFTMGALVQAMRADTTGIVVFGVLVAVGEYFYHQYLERAEKVTP